MAVHVSAGIGNRAARTVPVPVVPLDAAELQGFIGSVRQTALHAAGGRAASALSGRVVMHVSSTATGGGLAEMLPTLLGYTAGFGVDVRWSVVRGDPAFAAVTRRMVDRIHGHRGDDGVLGPRERATYEAISAIAGQELLDVLRPGDIAVLHDPQTLGLAPLLRRGGVVPIWRCHIGSDGVDGLTEEAWDFLEPYLDHVAAFVFSRATYRPRRIAAQRTRVITPSLDPLSSKNYALTAPEVVDILTATGLLGGSAATAPVFRRRDGSVARLTRRAEVIQTGGPPSIQEPLVVQVSRWDRRKDMIGVMTAFAGYVAGTGSGHLVLAGPSVGGGAGDPEGAAQWQACIQLWQRLPDEQRRRIHLACLPVVDAQENAVIVNALQRHAAVVTQKSLAEGFGLTVLEAMWKGRPVVASAVGGIRDQLDDRRCGLLLSDATDLAVFGRMVRRLLDDQALARTMGRHAARRAADFLPDQHLTSWAGLLIDVIAC